VATLSEPQRDGCTDDPGPDDNHMHVPTVAGKGRLV